MDEAEPLGKLAEALRVCFEEGNPGGTLRDPNRLFWAGTASEPYVTLNPQSLRTGDSAGKPPQQAGV